MYTTVPAAEDQEEVERQIEQFKYTSKQVSEATAVDVGCCLRQEEGHAGVREEHQELYTISLK